MSLTKEDRINQSPAGTPLRSQRFADAIAMALHREYDGTRSAVKTVVALTGANERAVKNWFDAKNAPSGEFLIELCRHSDEVLSTFLLLAGRREQVTAGRLVQTRKKLREVLAVLSSLDEP
jgi:membrane protein required for beta-lactamase induction